MHSEAEFFEGNGSQKSAFYTLNGGAEMKYMLLIYQDENGLSETERTECYEKSAQFAVELSKGGQYLDAGPLHPTSTATSVRIRDNKSLVTDGPFAETREQLGGYFLIDAKNLDEAIGIAERIPAGRWGTVEIRPVMEISGLPTA
jgi:hypothetical protein